MNRMKPLAAMSALALLAGSVQAAMITVDNHSFENPALAAGGATFDNPGWINVAGDPGIGSPTLAEYPGGVPDGVNYAWFNLPTDTLSQDVGALTANTTYTLTVATGWRLDLSNNPSYSNYPGYRIELWANGVMVASDADTQNGGTGTGPAAGTWKDVTTSFSTGAGVSGNLEIRLRGGSAVNGGLAVQTNYDNVRLDGSPVPEPGSLALLGLGGLLIARRRRD